ncbi:MAG: hypothetical protein ABI340_06970 [Nitrososphaera sp.]
MINHTVDKTSAFKEAHRILKNGGRMVISDLVTDRELDQNQVNTEQWCSRRR